MLQIYGRCCYLLFPKHVCDGLCMYLCFHAFSILSLGKSAYCAQWQWQAEHQCVVYIFTPKTTGKLCKWKWKTRARPK